jgi:TolA-binding protein
MISVFFGFVSLLVFAQPVADADRDWLRIRELVDRGKESSAELSSYDFLRRYPDHTRVPDVWMVLGDLRFGARRFAEAITEYQKVIASKQSSNEQRGRASLQIGRCHVQLNQPTWAKIEFSAVLRRFPKHELGKDAAKELGGLSK